MKRLTAVPRTEGGPAMKGRNDLPRGGREPVDDIDDRFLDRDESDLAYIRRIAARGVDAGIPLLERLRFLEIAEAVLDEFVAVRLCRVDAAVAETVRAGIAALRRCLLDAVRTVMPGLRDRFSFPAHRPQPVEAVERFDGDIFAAMAAGDFFLHSPYHRFDAFSALLWQAARDPAVIAIRQTLYRTEESVVEHLLEAARRGKDVTAVVEIEARENERQNIDISRELERAGAHIVHGIVGLKVHAKLLHIVRREDDTLREYGVFSTGNFHPGNAAGYGDLTLFTAAPVLAGDLRRLLHYVTGHLPTPGTQRLVAAPLDLRDALIARIRREADNARAGRASGIWFKVNSLLDYYLPAYFEDDVDSWRLEPDGSWARLAATGRSAQASFGRSPLG